jgi:hypothetical protein
MSRPYRFVIGIASICLLATISATAQAGTIELVDQGDNYTNDGQNWQQPPFTGNTVTIAGGVFVPLNFGSGAPASRKVIVDPRGQIVFVDASNNPTGDFFAPFLAPVAWTPNTNFGGSIEQTFGFVDPKVLDSANPSGPFNPADGLPAYRFWWNSVCPSIGTCDNSTTVSFQAILFGLGNDAFVLQFNYGLNSFSPAGATAGYSLGANVASFAGPFSDVGPDYCFQGGVARAFTTVAACRGTIAAVPEPATIALFVTGFTLLVGASLRRRGSISAILPA